VAKLEMIKGISSEHRTILRNECAINSVSALLKAGTTPAGRDAIAEMTGAETSLVLEWLHQADLTRIKGIGREYVGLLNAVSIKTLSDLKRQSAEDLYVTMDSVNGNHCLVHRLPTLEMVIDWIEQANELSPTISE